MYLACTNVNQQPLLLCIWHSSCQVSCLAVLYKYFLAIARPCLLPSSRLLNVVNSLLPLPGSARLQLLLLRPSPKPVLAFVQSFPLVGLGSFVLVPLQGL